MVVRGTLSKTGLIYIHIGNINQADTSVAGIVIENVELTQYHPGIVYGTSQKQISYY